MPTPDGLIIVSFGGPEAPDQVDDFLERISEGRNIPPKRLEEVAERYLAAGGVSPANENNRKLIKRISKVLKSAGLDMKLYLGNRNSPPLLADTVKEMQKDGVTNALAFITSPFASYSSCRQYLENIESALAGLNDAPPPQIQRLPFFHSHPLFVEIFVDAVKTALDELKEFSNPHILFSAHSLPLTMAENCEYVNQLKNTCELVMAELHQKLADATTPSWQIVYQSISGNPKDWLEPDIKSAISNLVDNKSENSADAVLVVPIGFLSDHFEVIFDLDQDAKAHSQELKLGWARATTPQDDPRFAQLILELIQEHINSTDPYICAPNCCPRTSVK